MTCHVKHPDVYAGMADVIRFFRTCSAETALAMKDAVDAIVRERGLAPVPPKQTQAKVVAK